MKIERFKNTKRNAMMGALNKLISLVFPFINRTIILYVLGDQYLGVGSLFGSILSVLSLAELGFGSAIVYSMYRPIANDDTKTLCALLNLYKKIYRVIGIGITGLGLLIIPILNLLIKGTVPADMNLYLLYIMYLGNTSISYLLFAYKSSVFSAYQRNDIQSNISSVLMVAQCILQAIFLLITKSYYSYIGVMIAATIANNLLIEFYSRKNYPQLKAEGTLQPEIVADIKTKIKALVLHKFGGVMANSFDNIVISAFIGLRSIAIYGNYHYILTGVASFLNIFYNGLLGGVGNSIASESLERNREQFQQLTAANNCITAWCSICLLCIYQPFMNLWVGEELMFGFETVFLFALYFYVNFTRRIVVTYKDACGLWQSDQLKPFISGIVNLILNIILVRFLGVNGVIVTTIFCFCVIEKPWETHALFHNYFKTGEKEFYLGQIKFMLLALFAATITYYVCDRIRITNHFLDFSLTAIVCALLSASLLILPMRNQLKFVKKYLKR